jgi:predicted nucleic acid-binding protein
MVTGEPPDLAIEVREFMKKVNHREYILRISPLVIAECCWVLESYYEQKPADIANVLQLLSQLLPHTLRLEARACH